jgi:hypothetical protein
MMLKIFTEIDAMNWVLAFVDTWLPIEPLR